MPDVLTRLRELREERVTAFEEMRSIQDLADTEERDLTAEERQTWDRLDARIVEIGGDDGTGGEIDRLDRYAQRLRDERSDDPARRRLLPDGGTGDDDEPRQYQSFAEFLEHEGRQRPNAQGAYNGAFYRLLRGGLSDSRFQRLPEEDRRLLDAAREEPWDDQSPEGRALSAVVGAEGGYAVPVTTEGRIIERADATSPLRRLCNVITTASGEEIHIPLEADIGDADWVAENTDYHEADIVFGLAKLRAFKLTTVVFVPRELLTDAVFDIEAYLIRVLGRRLGRAQNAAYAVGAPVDPLNPGKPTGIYPRLTVGVTAPGNGGAGAFLASKPFTGDDLIDLQEEVDEAYQPNAEWVVGKAAAKAARKLKDNDGQYLLVPGLREGETDQLLGSPLNRDAFLGGPAATADSVVAAYGDWSEAATIRDVAGVFVQRLNELRATKGQVGFLADHRSDINITNADAVKALKTHA